MSPEPGRHASALVPKRLRQAKSPKHDFVTHIGREQVKSLLGSYDLFRRGGKNLSPEVSVGVQRTGNVCCSRIGPGLLLNDRHGALVFSWRAGSVP
jgi:hypothetical protein